MIDKVISCKKDCTGCHGCVNVCPQKCIEMKEDDEGFLYPNVDYNICISCKKCVKVCPMIIDFKIINNPIAYACINKDDFIRQNSSSGGIFTLFAESVINSGGVVFGAIFNNDFEVEHNYVESIEKLELLRGSKYVQSKIGFTYKHIKDFLVSGREVLFSGTPCQIAGLKTYLEKAYPNLITIDVICHGVPSPYVWHKYVKYRESKAKSTVKGVTFRKKHTGWKNYSVSFTFKNDTEYNNTFSKDIYMKAFLHDSGY